MQPSPLTSVSLCYTPDLHAAIDDVELIAALPADATAQPIEAAVRSKTEGFVKLSGPSLLPNGEAVVYDVWNLPDFLRPQDKQKFFSGRTFMYRVGHGGLVV